MHKNHGLQLNLENHIDNDDFIIACAQFGFDFEYTIVSKTEYENFIRLPPGDLWFYIYKEKQLCDHLNHCGSYGNSVSARFDNGVSFSINEKYTRKVIQDDDVKYAINDYNLIVDDKLNIEFNNHTDGIPESHEKAIRDFIDNNRAKQVKDELLSEIGTITNMKNNMKGIRFFSYIIEIQEDKIMIFTPEKVKLVTVNDVLSKIYNDDTLLPKDITMNLDKEQISMPLRKAFKAGIQWAIQFPLYLADDAVVKVIESGKKWGIINYKYSGYYTIHDTSEFTLFDKDKFKLKTFKEPWLIPEDRTDPGCRERWKKLLINKFKECCYPLSRHIEIEIEDERDWQIYTHARYTNAPEWHIIRNNKGNTDYLIYMTRYVKVNVKNPDEVIAKIEEVLIRAFIENVNVLCLPELSLFLPHDKLKNMLRSVLGKCTDYNKNRAEKVKKRFSDIIVFSTTYLKFIRNSDRCVNLGVGVNIQLDESGIVVEKTTVLTFQKQYYAPIEYRNNNITPDAFAGLDDHKAYKGNFFKWLEINYWDMIYYPMDHANYSPGGKSPENRYHVHKITFSRKTRDNKKYVIYPFICSDFIATKLYNHTALLENYKRSVAEAEEETINIIVIPSYSPAVYDFYKNIDKFKENTDVIVFSNNVLQVNNYGRSFVYSWYHPETHKKTNSGYCIHFDSFTKALSNLLNDNERQNEPGSNMIMITIKSNSQ